eukprot:765978-Hanusia_phi.AAC.7
MASEEEEFRLLAPPHPWEGASVGRFSARGGSGVLHGEGGELTLSDLQQEEQAIKIEKIRKQLAMSHVAVVGRKKGAAPSCRPSDDGLVDVIARTRERGEGHESLKGVMTRSLVETRSSKSAEVISQLLSSLADKERLWGEEMMRGSKLEAENAELRAEVEALQEKTKYLQHRLRANHESYNKSMEEMNSKLMKKDEEISELQTHNLSLVEKLLRCKTRIRQLAERNRLMQRFSAAGSASRRKREDSSEDDSLEGSEADMADETIDRKIYKKKLQELYSLKALRR